MLKSMTVTASYPCVQKPVDTNIYDGKMNFKGSTLLCINNIGLSMCIEQCHRMEGCNLINYDRDKLYCDLMLSENLMEADFMSEKKKVIALRKRNGSVSD